MPIFLLIFVHNVVIVPIKFEVYHNTKELGLVNSFNSNIINEQFGGIDFLFGLKIIKLVLLMFKESLFILNQDTIFTISVLIILMRVSKS